MKISLLVKSFKVGVLLRKSTLGWIKREEANEGTGVSEFGKGG